MTNVCLPFFYIFTTIRQFVESLIIAITYYTEEKVVATVLEEMLHQN